MTLVPFFQIHCQILRSSNGEVLVDVIGVDLVAHEQVLIAQVAIFKISLHDPLLINGLYE